MLHLYIFILALCVAIGIAAISVASALAVSEWLAGGNAIAVALAAESKGEVSLENMGTKMEIICSVTFIGTIGPTEVDTLTEVLTLGNLVQNPLICSLTKPGTCEEPVGAGIGVSFLNLPWGSVILLITVGGVALFVDMIQSGGAGVPKYLYECKILGMKVDMTCESEPGAEMKDIVGGGVEMSFSEEEVVNPPGKCEPGKNMALIKGVINLLAAEVVSLS